MKNFRIRVLLEKNKFTSFKYLVCSYIYIKIKLHKKLNFFKCNFDNGLVIQEEFTQNVPNRFVVH